MQAVLRLLAAVALAAFVAWIVGAAHSATPTAKTDPLVQLFGKPTITQPPALHNGQWYRCADWWFGRQTVVVRCFISAAATKPAPSSLAS